tara:strand:- start:1585 stop:2559 length:975 start_codon:yes stop_codon:yes gene_type:complete
MNIKFQCYYDQNRFLPLHKKITGRTNYKHSGPEIVRKTACFLSEKFNVFVDSSDGVNEDLPVNEYCGRMTKIVKSFNKPFLYFKCNSSINKSADIKNMAASHGGKLLPFFMWNLHSQNPKFYTEIIPNQKLWIEKNKKTKKQIDILYAAVSKLYEYPKPCITDNKIPWSDFKNFGVGHPQDTGWFHMNTRDEIYDRLSKANNYTIERFQKKLEYIEYMKSSLRFKLQFCPPGVGEYTCRIFNSAAIGQTVLLRKSTYDFYDSWKNYFPEVDLKNQDFESKIVKIIDNYEDWNEKALEYFETSLSEKRLIEVFEKEIVKFYEELK